MAKQRQTNIFSHFGKKSIGSIQFNGKIIHMIFPIKICINFHTQQGFILALLLTSIFHKGLSFMAVGHNPTCISTLTLAVGGSRPQVFKSAFPCIIWCPNKSFPFLSFFFLGLFAPLMTHKGNKRINKALSKQPKQFLLLFYFLFQRIQFQNSIHD